MSHSEICPICNGKGKKQIFTPTSSSTMPILEICNGCGGCGWITVQDGEYNYNLTGGKYENKNNKM